MNSFQLTRNEANDPDIFLLWESHERINQVELFSTLENLIAEHTDESAGFDHILFSIGNYYSPGVFRYINVTCTLDDIPRLLPIMLKPRNHYQTEIQIRFEISGPKKHKEANWDICFIGGKRCVLALQGDFTAEEVFLLKED